ncbi:MAG: GvpL/GvpF family gas vesicle protein [Trueperaceae bacterium]|nr:GvpL/GvpF family gas vesicle protein [Trueperaceae bacterium]
MASPLYLYCFSEAGITAPDVASVGKTGAPFVLEHQGLAAVLSENAEARYRVSRKNLLAHNGVVEAVMAQAPTLPVRFGTLAPSQDAARALLAERNDELKAALARLRGQVEYAVRVRWQDEQAVLADIGERDPDVVRTREALVKRGQVDYQAKIALGQQVEQALGARATFVANSLTELAEQHAERVRDNDVAGDIVNLSLLMPPERYDDFMGDVEAFDNEHGDHLRIKITGPLPPFSFAEMAITW